MSIDGGRGPDDDRAPASSPGAPGPAGRGRPRGGGEPPAAWTTGLYLGRPLGVPLYVAPTWMLFVAWITVAFAPLVHDRLPDLGSRAYAVSATFGVLLGVSILVHELSHAAVALRLGLPVRRMTLHLLGGVTVIDKEPDTPRRAVAVAVVGPIVSLAIGAVAWGAFTFLEPRSVAGILAGALAVSNGLVGLFNLLPGLPLDGGLVLRAVIWGATKKPMTATLAAARTGRVLAVLVVVGALVASAAAPDTVDLLSVVWAVFIAWYVWAGATYAVRSAFVRERLPQVSARSLTRRALRVSADLPLAEALRRAGEVSARGLIIVDSEGHATGVVEEAAVVATPDDKRPWVSVGALARGTGPEHYLPAELAGEDLIKAMQRVPAPEYVVVLPDGEIYGVLATADVVAAVGH